MKEIGIVISDGKAGKGSVGCDDCDGAGGVPVRAVVPFPLDPRAIVTVVSIACCLADEKRNNDLKKADESLMS